MRSSLILLIIIFFSSLSQAGIPQSVSDCLKSSSESVQEIKPLYAQGFTFFKGKGFSFIEFKKGYALKGGSEIILISSGPFSCPGLRTFRPPFKKVLSLSTTFIPLFDFGKMNNVLIGISGKNFINSPWALEKIKIGQLKDIGYPPNLEAIATLGTDLILLYPLAEQEFSLEQKFKALKLNYLGLAEYLEPHPLGRAEWSKVFCAVMNCPNDAEKDFLAIVKSYEKTKSDVQKIALHPKVMMGSFWGGEWQSPGGDSYLAKLVEDAGGDYVFSSPKEAKTKALDFEFVYSVFSRINFWLPHASIENLKSLQKDDPRYKMLNKFPLKIYNYDKIKSENGGIDFWENGVYRPDLVLLDLAKIFHPELVPTHSLIWYRALQW